MLNQHQIQQLENEVWYKAVRSRGPGGQNVNKVSSAAILYWDLKNSAIFDDEKKQLVQNSPLIDISSDSWIWIRSDQFRDLPMNKKHCFDALVQILRKILTPPKKRVATKIPRSQKKQRLQCKRIQSQKIANRNWRDNS